MEKFIPINKKSKKAQKEYYAKKLIEKRVPRDYSFSEMLGAGQVTIKNASGTWIKSPDGMQVAL